MRVLARHTLLLGGRVPAPLRIPHAPVIRQRPPEVTTELYELILVIVI